LQEEKLAVMQSQTEIKKARAVVFLPFTREEYKLIMGMLHPDRHPGREDRAERAIGIFRRIENVCKKKQPKLKSVG
jgi:hypothetical protein